MLLIGVVGIELIVQECDWLQYDVVVGVVLFKCNFVLCQQVIDLSVVICVVVLCLQLICVDQEGGCVQCFCEGYSDFLLLQDIGVLYVIDLQQVLVLVEQYVWLMVSEVCVSGLDFSFVLVVDFGRGNCVIGNCVFSEDLQVVVVFIVVYVCGMYVVGMVVMFKYFFGYGIVLEDIYVDIVIDLCVLDELCVQDLVLFQVGIVVGVDVVMMVYVIYLQVVLEFVGYFLCWIQDVLCGEFGFRGVVFFDDIGMVVLYSVGGVLVCVYVYLDVGCDVVLVCYLELVDEVLYVVQGCFFNIVVLLGLFGRGVFGWDGLLVDVCYGDI